MYINNLNIKEIDSSTLEQETCKKFNELQNLQLILKRLKQKLRDKDKNYSKYKRFHDNIFTIIQFKLSNDTITKGGSVLRDIEYELIGKNKVIINNEELILEDTTHTDSNKCQGSAERGNDVVGAEYPSKSGEISSKGGYKSVNSGKRLLKKGGDEEGEDSCLNKNEIVYVNEERVVKLHEHIYVPLEYYNKLYVHQKNALSWLVKLHVSNLGGILADDMGLGKTITVLSLINTLIYSSNLLVRGVSSISEGKGEGNSSELMDEGGKNVTRGGSQKDGKGVNKVEIGVNSIYYPGTGSSNLLSSTDATSSSSDTIKDGSGSMSRVYRILIVSNVTLIDQWRSEINNWIFNNIKLYILHSNYDINSDYYSPRVNNGGSCDNVKVGSGKDVGSGSVIGSPDGNMSGSSVQEELIEDVSYIVYLVGYEYLRVNIEYINNYEWSYLILDEGQKIRNPNSLITLAVKTIKTPHRIVVSGSPIQNNLIELWSIIDFILPNYLGSLNSFIEEYVVPISSNSLNNKYINKLKLLILPYIFRTLKANLKKKNDLFDKIADPNLTDEEEGGEGGEGKQMEDGNGDIPEPEKEGKKEVELPNKVERIILCNLTVEQYKLYIEVLNKYKYSNKHPGNSGYTLTGDVKKLIGKELTRDKHILKVIGILRKICNHPKLLIRSSSSVLDSVTEENDEMCTLEDYVDTSDELGDGKGGGYGSNSHGLTSTVHGIGHSTRLHSKIGRRNCDITNSSKLNVCLKIIDIWKGENSKILVFTQTISMLSIIYHELLSSYKKGQIAILHGKIGINARNKVIESFRSDENIFIMLLTTKVGGIGLNLTVATRIIIYDPDWNPMTDLQARERSYRIGQKKKVIIYRLITANTIEEKIYQRQLYKCYLTNKILNYNNVLFYNKYINNLQYILSYPPPPVGVTTSKIATSITTTGSSGDAISETVTKNDAIVPTISTLKSKINAEDEDKFYKLLVNNDRSNNINSYIKYNDIINNIQETTQNSNYASLSMENRSPIRSSATPMSKNMDKSVGMNKQLLYNLKGKNNKNIKYIITNQILHYFNNHNSQKITTNNLINYFKPIIADEYHKLFKSILKQLCTLVKNDKSSHWKLNSKYANVLPR